MELVTNFFLMKFGKLCLYIGPYELAFDDPAIEVEEDIEE